MNVVASYLCKQNDGKELDRREAQEVYSAESAALRAYTSIGTPEFFAALVEYADAHNAEAEAVIRHGYGSDEHTTADERLRTAMAVLDDIRFSEEATHE